MNDRQVLTIQEAAELLGLPYGTVYDQVRFRRLPALRMGKRWLITIEDLQRYLKAMGNGAEVPKLDQTAAYGLETRRRFVLAQLDPMNSICLPSSF